MQWQDIYLQLHRVPFVHWVLLLFWGAGVCGTNFIFFAFFSFSFLFQCQSTKVFWMDDASWKARAWSLTKSLFFKIEKKNSSRFYKVRINPFLKRCNGTWRKQIIWEEFLCDYPTELLPTKVSSLLHNPDSQSKIYQCKPIISRTTDIFTFISIFKTHTLPNLMVRKPASFIQNTYFWIL